MVEMPAVLCLFELLSSSSASAGKFSGDDGASVARSTSAQKHGDADEQLPALTSGDETLAEGKVLKTWFL